LERSAASLFRNNSRPGGVITVKGSLRAEAAGRLAQAWKAAHGGDKSGGVAILDNEGKYEPVAFNSVDSQQAEQRAFAVNEISRLTRVPVTMLSDLSRATWSNTEQLQLQFLQVCMLPWLREWTDAYSRVLISRDERKTLSFDFITDDLLRADTAARAEAYSKLRAAGVVTANEVRRLENLPPIDGGDVLQNPFTTSGKQPANDNTNPKENAA
jgi:HK97 family phage portal protein